MNGHNYSIFCLNSLCQKGGANNQQRHGEADGVPVYGPRAGVVDQAGLPQSAGARRVVLRPVPAPHRAGELVRRL